MRLRPICRCGHPYAAHEHYRAGTDCGLCPTGHCPRYRPAGMAGALQALPRAIGKAVGRTGRDEGGG